jgi:hypothetical protein
MLSPTSLIISAALVSERWGADAAQEREISPDYCSFARREEKKWDTGERLSQKFFQMNS